MERFVKMTHFVVLSILCGLLFAEGTPLQKKFIAGSLSDKASAVKEAVGAESIELSTNAIAFCLNYQTILGNDDGDLSRLAASAVESISTNYIRNSMTNAEQSSLMEDFYKLYTLFLDESLKVAILNKLSELKVDSRDFVSLLNKEMKDTSLTDEQKCAIINALCAIGNKETFSLLFSFIDPQQRQSASPAVSDAIKNGLMTLAQRPPVEIASFIQKSGPAQCRLIFDLCVKTESVSTKQVFFMAQIAENVLSRTTYIGENAPAVADELLSLQYDAFCYLVSQKWTRATKSATRYFLVAKKFYNNKRLTDETFKGIITGLVVIAPLDCVSVLSSYIMEVNKQKEAQYTPTSYDVLITAIDVLGNLGDRGAFDSLLSVTYYDYPDNVLDVAKDALAKLRLQ